MSIYRDRLFNVARALREAPRPDRFNMESFGGFCGTPHCAIGHYAARQDLQKTFRLGLLTGDLKTHTGFTSYSGSAICAHFQISKQEAAELFGPHGCGAAETPEQAATYIETFVARKWPGEVSRATLEPAYSKLRKQLQAVS